jgi:hypothetical protein
MIDSANTAPPHLRVSINHAPVCDDGIRRMNRRASVGSLIVRFQLTMMMEAILATDR